VLPETFASDPYRLARFQREAEVLASLNHQNIDNSYRSNFLTIVRPAKSWHVQWETVPPGKESEPRSLGCIRGGNESDEAN
jgi:hypothetical protein